MGIEISFGNAISVADYIYLRESVGFSKVSARQIQTALEQSDYIIVANLGNKSIGMARLMNDGLQVFIMDVIVHPNYQGKGIGKKLMEYVIGYIKQFTCEDEKVLVNLLTDSSKVGFYEQFGFQRAEGMRLRL